MTAEIGLSEPLLLVWLVMWIGVDALIAFAAAAIGVSLFGPREVDAVILPGMATLGVVLAGQWFGRLTMDEAPVLLGIAGAMGIGASAVQRLVGDRLDAEPARWRLVLPVGRSAAAPVNDTSTEPPEQASPPPGA